MKKFILPFFIGLFLIGFAQQQQFTTPGAATFIIPNSVVSIKVECIGGGGAGGRVEGDSWTFINNEAAGGGGGGSYVRAITSVVAGNAYNIQVGSGGISNGANGGNSWFGSNTTVMAEGGKTRGGVNNSGGANGGKAVNSYGDVKYDGGNGGSGDSNDAGGGGGGAGSSGSGGNGSNGSGSGLPLGGTGAIDYGGNGGGGGYDGDNGAAGSTFGGGGGGSSIQSNTDRNGGAGAGGIVILQWSEIHSLSKTQFCGNVQDTLLITGSNFINVDSVVLNNNTLTYSVLSANTIQVIVPMGASSGELFVHTKQGVSKSDSIYVQQNTLSLTVDSNIITANYSGNTNQANWIWFNCANNDTINTSTNTTLTVAEVGFYALTVEENACVLTAPCETVTNIPDTNTYTPIDTLVIPPDTVINEDSTTAIRHINSSATFVKVYPNPTSNKVFISSFETNITHVAVYSMTGKQIIDKDINTKETSLSFSELPQGVYLLKVMSNAKVNTYKVVRE